MAQTTESGGNWKLPKPELVYTAAVERQATTYLERAAMAFRGET